MGETAAAKIELLSRPVTVRDIQYEYSEEDRCFRHNLKRDLHIFCVWEKARQREKEIIRTLSESFRLLKVTEIEWPQDEITTNFGRLYKTIGQDENMKHKSVGSGPFLCIVVEDKNPKYFYEQSVSGNIELCNRKVVEAKRAIRSWFGGFLVHSTANPVEFIEQIHLLFDEQEADEIWRRSFCSIEPDRKKGSLVGHQGWRSFEELFSHLNRTTDYVVLRNFETLPDAYDESDLDILCADPGAFLSAVNGVEVERTDRRVKCMIRVEARSIETDVRFVGDGYYDTAWQQDILRQSELFMGVVRVPRADHLFFSLLYHCALQKRSITAKYQEKLGRIGREIGLSQEIIDSIPSSEASAMVVRNYFKASGYKFYTPLDRDVYTNRGALRRLWPSYVVFYSKPEHSLLHTCLSGMARVARRNVPEWMREYVPDRAKTWVRQI